MGVFGHASVCGKGGLRYRIGFQVKGPDDGFWWEFSDA